jgi:hypothetical protein
MNEAQVVGQQKVVPLKIVRWFTSSGYPPRNAPVYNAYASPLDRAEGTHRIIGDRFQGKSALGETIAYMYWKTGSSLYDLYAANDQENAAWANSPYADHVTFLVGSNCKLLFDYKQYNYMRAIDLDPRTVGPQNIFVACKRFFQDEEDYYRALWILCDKFKTRTTYDRVDVIFLREAQEVITGVMRAGQASNSKDASEAFIRFHNQLFHFGYAVVLDSQRDVEIAKSVRELGDYNYIKNLGGQEIPRKLWHTFRQIDPDRIYRRMMPWQFVLYAKNTSGLGVFMLPPWHLERGRDVLLKLGIRPSFEGVPDTPLEDRSHHGGPGRPKDVVLRQRIRQLLLAGGTYSAIGQELSCSNNVIAKMVVQLRKEGLMKPKVPEQKAAVAAPAETVGPES